MHLAEDQTRFVVSTEEESLLQYITVSSALSFSEVRIESRNNNIISLGAFRSQKMGRSACHCFTPHTVLQRLASPTLCTLSRRA